VATPGHGAGSGEELVAEVVSDAGDIGAHDDGLVVLQVESEEGGIAGRLAVVPDDGLATVEPEICQNSPMLVPGRVVVAWGERLDQHCPGFGGTPWPTTRLRRTATG